MLAGWETNSWTKNTSRAIKRVWRLWYTVKSNGQERLHGFGSYLSIRCTTIAVLFYLFHSPVALPFHPIQGKRRERLHDVLPIKIHCKVIWRRNWRCLSLSWKMHGFCSVAKKQAHVLFAKILNKIIARISWQNIKKISIVIFFYMQIYSWRNH